MEKQEFLKQFAKELTECNGDLTKEICDAAKNNGIVIVYGASDDLLEFDGAITDEFGCYGGGTFYFDENGDIIYLDEYVNKEEIAILSNRIDAIWCGKDTEWTWSYKTDIPHETFEIMDDDEKYCKGFVFYKDDLK